MNEFELFELENKAKSNIIGGRRAVTSMIVVGYDISPNGATFMDIQNSGTGDVLCHEPDADWGGFQPVGSEVG